MVSKQNLNCLFYIKYKTIFFFVFQNNKNCSGVDKARLYFTPLFPLKQHLVIKQKCHLFLDTPIFNAHGTATDALWAGIPLLTLMGNTMQSRAGIRLFFQFLMNFFKFFFIKKTLVNSCISLSSARRARTHHQHVPTIRRVGH